MPFTTPAADVYHATAAVTMPAQPPAWSHHAVPPCDRLKKPITSRISVISSVRKTMNTAVLTRMLQSSMYVLKIANANRNHASPFVRFEPAREAAKVFDTSASTLWVLKTANEKRTRGGRLGGWEPGGGAAKVFDTPGSTRRMRTPIQTPP